MGFIVTNATNTTSNDYRILIDNFSRQTEDLQPGGTCRKVFRLVKALAGFAWNSYTAACMSCGNRRTYRLLFSINELARQRSAQIVEAALSNLQHATIEAQSAQGFMTDFETKIRALDFPAEILPSTDIF